MITAIVLSVLLQTGGIGWLQFPVEPNNVLSQRLQLAACEQTAHVLTSYGYTAWCSPRIKL